MIFDRPLSAPKSRQAPVGQAGLFDQPGRVPPRRWLVVARVGASSLHAHWLGGAQRRSFDLFLSAYDPKVTDPNLPGVHFEYRPGHKVSGYAGLFRDHPDLLSRYDYIALLDDDIDADAATLNGVFATCSALDLKIAQPALSPDSHFTYAGLLRQSAFQLRFVNFIEMMCPVFRSDALAERLPLYEMGFESGIDLIWCNTADADARSYAVLDAWPVRHTKPVGAQMARNGFEAGRGYEDDIDAVLTRFDLPWLSCLPYAAVTRGGRLVDARRWTGRVRLMLSALGLLRAVPANRGGGRLRKVLVHLRHLGVGRAQNRSVTLPGASAPAGRPSDLPDVRSAQAS